MILVNKTKRIIELRNDKGETVYIPKGRHNIPNLTDEKKLPAGVQKISD